MSAYLSPAELADLLGAKEANVLRWRREHSWPSLKIGNQIRFSPDHVAQILARHEATVEQVEAPAVVIEGQTTRSARRSA